MTDKEERCWRYLLANRHAAIDEIARECDVSEEFARDLIDRIASENWREEIQKSQKADVDDVFNRALDGPYQSVPQDYGCETWEEVAAGASALERQEGGSHYQTMRVQPWQAMEAWLTPEEYRGYHKGVAIGYLARERQKGGDEDIRKAVHHLQRLIETWGEK